MPIVERCEVCNFRLPRVQREDTRYCGSTCRVRASRARRKGRLNADLKRRFAWSRTPVDTRSWVLRWYRRLAHGPLRALAEQRKETHLLRVQLAEARDTIQRQAEELTNLKEQLAALAEQSDRDAVSLRELRAESDTANERARTTTTELEEIRGHLKRRFAEAEDANQSLRDARHCIAAHENELAAVREQSTERSNRVVALEAQLAEAKQDNARREMQLAALAKRFVDAARALDRTRDEARTARAERDRAQVQALTAEAALEKSQWLVRVQSSESVENLNKWTAAERRVAHLRRKLAQARATSTARRRRATALGVQLAKVKHDAERQQAEHDRQLKDANERLAQQEQSIQTVLGERDIARAEALMLQTGVQLLTPMLQQAFQKNDTLEAELAKSRVSNQELTASFTEARESIQKAQRELERYKAETEAELAELRAHRDRTKDPTAELRAAKDEICRLQGRVISAENKRDEAKRVLEIKRTLFTDRERSLENQVRQLKDQIRTLIK